MKKMSSLVSTKYVLLININQVIEIMGAQNSSNHVKPNYDQKVSTQKQLIPGTQRPTQPNKPNTLPNFFTQSIKKSGDDIQVKQIFAQEALLSRIQKFKFPDPYIRYKIMPAQQDKLVLDVANKGKKKSQKGTVLLWEYKGGPNQLFYLSKVDEKRFIIINVASLFAITVHNEEDANGSMITCQPRNNSKSQVWQLLEEGKNIYQIQSFCGKCLNVDKAIMRKGNPVTQYKWEHKRYQKWKIWPG